MVNRENRWANRGKLKKKSPIRKMQNGRKDGKSFARLLGNTRGTGETWGLIPGGRGNALKKDGERRRGPGGSLGKRLPRLYRLLENRKEKQGDQANQVK